MRQKREGAPVLDIAAVCLVITALLAYVNHRFVGMPTTIGVMATALVFSLALVGLDALGVAHGLREYEESLLRSIDFSDVLMQGMLSLPAGPERNTVVALTYCVVVFSILVQGLSIGRVTRLAMAPR